MLFLKMRSKGRSSARWDQAKAEYENAIHSCYKWERVQLALCGLRKFAAFNFRYEEGTPRKPYIEDDFEAYGVVHEESKRERHVRCEVEVSNDPIVGDAMGYLVLTHCLNDGGKGSRREEQVLQLNVSLYDPAAVLKQSLVDGIRDAALSGCRFMHIELVCAALTGNEVEKIVTDIREKGYGSRRDVVAVKMRPSIELERSPQWAR